MKQATRQPAGDKGTADRIGADEGHYWVRLVTRQALDREGLCMGHCVGHGDYDRHAGSEEMEDDAIWSLRRPDGVSVLTVEVLDLRLQYAKGPRNSQPGKFEALQVAHLVAGFKEAGHVLRVDEDTEIVLLEDGRTFRIDRLPPDIVAAREAAEQERRAAAEARERASRWVRVERHPLRFRPMAGGIFATFNPDAEFFGDVERLRPEFRATMGEADPVVQLEHNVGGPFRYRTRAGIEFELEPTSVPGMRDVPPTTTISSFVAAFLEAYRAAVGQAPAAPVAQVAGGGLLGPGSPFHVVSMAEALDAASLVPQFDPVPAPEATPAPSEPAPEPTGDSTYFSSPRGMNSIAQAFDAARREANSAELDTMRTAILHGLVSPEELSRIGTIVPAPRQYGGRADGGFIVEDRAFLAPERFGSVTLRPGIIHEGGPRG